MEFGIPRPTTPNTVMYDGAGDSLDNALAKKLVNLIMLRVTGT